MNLKSNMMNNAITGFITMFKSGSRSFIVKRLSAFVLSLIIFVSSVFCQYCTAVVSAAEVGAIVAVDLIVELAVTGGIVAGIMRGAQILQGEIDSGYGFGSAGLDDYANSVNQQLIDGVNDGRISNSQAGTVKKLSGVPVEIVCPVYGVYQFLCTNELCNKIRMENPQTEEAVKQIVSSYWSSVNILDQQAFEEIASDPKNWVTNLDQLNTTGHAIVAQSVFESYGEILSEPDQTFFDTGLWATASIGSNSNYRNSINPGVISSYNDFCIVRYPSIYTANNRAITGFALYGHLNTQVDTALYDRITAFWAYDDQLHWVNYTSGLRSITIDAEKANELGFGSNAIAPITLSLDELFPNWGDMWGIEATDALNLIDWCLGDSRFWNTDIIDLAVDEIADAVDAKVETGEDAGAVDVPLDFPIDIPIEGVGDVAFPGTDTEEDFDDPPAYPRTDEWADVDTTDWPTFDPDPEDPDPEDPDNPSGGDAPELPQLRIPVLLTLFPFCIPFDIKRSIEWFGNAGNSSSLANNSVSEQYNTGVYNNMSASEAEEINGNGMEPVFAIPLNIGVSGRPVLQATVVLDLTEYGIPVLVQYLKTVQMIAWIIVLCWGTYKVIY